MVRLSHKLAVGIDGGDFTTEVIILPIEDKTYSREELKKAMLEAAGWGMLLPSAMRGQNADKGLAAFDEWFDLNY